MILDKFIARLSGREKLSVTVMAVVLSILFVDRTVIRAVSNRLNELNDQTKTAIRTLKFNYAILQTQPSVTEQYDKVKDSLELPLTDEEILAETESRFLRPLLQKNAIVVESTKALPSSLPPVGSAREYVIELTGVEGDTVKLLEFMHEVNQLPGLYRITQVHLVPGDLPQRVKGSIAVARLVLRTQVETSEPQPASP
jgi:hypothetical protein